MAIPPLKRAIGNGLYRPNRSQQVLIWHTSIYEASLTYTPKLRQAQFVFKALQLVKKETVHFIIKSDVRGYAKNFLEDISSAASIACTFCNNSADPKLLEILRKLEKLHL